MNRRGLWALLLVVLAVFLGAMIFSTERPGGWLYRPFQLGLDLRGGSHLVYEANVKELPSGDVPEAMAALRKVIERRIGQRRLAGTLGVLEPVIQVEQSGFGSEARHRLIVELPGVTDLDEAQAVIEATPFLEFRLVDESADPPAFTDSGLNGRFLRRAEVQFDQFSLGPSISVSFNDEGAKILARITRENLGRPLAIFLDAELLSAPVIRDEIRDGQAEITGQFTLDEAREFATNLNLGALPVPIKIASVQTIGASLGEEVLTAGVRAGLWGLVLVLGFMIFWYRLPGVVAALALGLYLALTLSVFKLLPVTITAAGIAGFILSLGLAVDANVLIFERMKEERAAGRPLNEAAANGFVRAWSSIRDSNLSTLISAAVLFWFGSSMVRGFALTLGLGIVISMFTAITAIRVWLGFLAERRRLPASLFGSGRSS